MSKIRIDYIRKEYEELDKDELLDDVVDKVLEIEKLKRKLRAYPSWSIFVKAPDSDASQKFV